MSGLLCKGQLAIDNFQLTFYVDWILFGAIFVCVKFKISSGTISSQSFNICTFRI